ncbi:hypothetical protein [Streptomyces capitiformicae]|uniref:hypothetical protein n=1 Tax=Streptomyces capitiformicae TaxID=2014920 RepID=UPI0038CDC0EE
MTGAGYGQNSDFRTDLAERGHAYVIGIRGDITSSRTRRTRRTRLVRHRPPAGAPLPAAAWCRWRTWQRPPDGKAFREVTWRESSRAPMTSRFLAMRSGRPAGARPRRLAQAAAVAERGRWDGVLPRVRLPAEGPTARTDRSASGCPTCPARPRSRSWSGWQRSVAHRAPLRRTQARPGPGPFEGRSFNGWHHARSSTSSRSC